MQPRATVIEITHKRTKLLETTKEIKLQQLASEFKNIL